MVQKKIMCGREENGENWKRTLRKQEEEKGNNERSYKPHIFEA